MKFSIKGFFSKCDQIRSFLRIWSHLLKKSLIENFILCAVKKSIKQEVKAYQINLNLKQFQMLSSTLRYFPRINRRIFMLKYILYLVFVCIQISRKGRISGFHHISLQNASKVIPYCQMDYLAFSNKAFQIKEKGNITFCQSNYRFVLL